MNKIFSHFLSLFKARRCVYCDETYQTQSATNEFYALCPSCCSLLKRYTLSYCTHCGHIPKDAVSNIKLSTCEHCINKKMPWDRLLFFSLYENTLQDIIKEAKFNDNLILTRTLADLIAPLLKEFPPFDYIVPMPLHEKRIQERGYNQCVEIAKYIHKKHHYPYETKALQKIKHTKPQSTLKQSERKTSLQDAFIADKNIVKGKTIVLLDDVSTTGSTLFWATKALKKANAKEVYVAYIAAVKSYN